MAKNRLRIVFLILLIIPLLVTPCNMGCSRLSKPRILQQNIVVPLTNYYSTWLSLKAGDRVVIEFRTDCEYDLDFWITHKEPIGPDSYITLEEYKLEDVKQGKVAFFAPISTTYEIFLWGPFLEKSDRPIYGRSFMDAYLNIYINQSPG
jgi:hypothetical protein